MRGPTILVSFQEGVTVNTATADRVVEKGIGSADLIAYSTTSAPATVRAALLAALGDGSAATVDAFLKAVETRNYSVVYHNTRTTPHAADENGCCSPTTATTCNELFIVYDRVRLNRKGPPGSVGIWFGILNKTEAEIREEENELKNIILRRQSRSEEYLAKDCVDFRVAHVEQICPMIDSVLSLVSRLPGGTTTLPTTLRRLSDLCKSQFNQRPCSRSLSFSPFVKVAYLFVPSKAKRFHQDGLLNSSPSCFFIPLSPYLPLRLQIEALSVPPDFLVFKLSDYIASRSFPKSAAILRDMYDLCVPEGDDEGQHGRDSECTHPRIRTLTPLWPQVLMMDRLAFLQQLSKVCDNMRIDGMTSSTLRVAPFTRVSFDAKEEEVASAIYASDMYFPVVCKGRISGGLGSAHLIATAYSANGVLQFGSHLMRQQQAEEDQKSIEEGRGGQQQPQQRLDSDYSTAADRRRCPAWLLSGIPSEIVVQQFIPHDSCVFKVFVCGSAVHVAVDRGIPAVHRETFSSFCESLINAKPDSSKETPLQDDEMQQQDFVAFNSADLKQPVSAWSRVKENLDMELVHRFCNCVGSSFGTRLFGLDLLVPEKGDIVVIDINFFPSYAKFPDFRARFLDFIMSSYTSRTTEQDDVKDSSASPPHHHYYP